MIIYVMRHGETVWNKKGITQGISNNRLSKDGKIQAKTTGEKTKDINFDVIISSPLVRTIQTSNIVNSFHNVKIVKNPKIIEVAQGKFTGTKYKDLTDEEKKQKATRSEEFGMESIEKIYNRCKDFVRELKTEYADKCVLVVTHNMVASMLELIANFDKYNENDFANLKLFDNAELKKIEI